MLLRVPGDAVGGFGSNVDFESDSVVLDVTFLGVENVGP